MFIKGISGGQKKRLCIAVEVITKPKLLILDEPTSGLDSHMAKEVMTIMNKMADEGKTLIFTIHQPSYKIYSELDRLILLDRGQCVYDGSASQIASYIQSLGIQVPLKTNISDFFMFEMSEFKARTSTYTSPLNNQSYTNKIKGDVEKKLDRILNEESMVKI